MKTSFVLGVGILFALSSPIAAVTPRPVGPEIAVNAATLGSHSGPQPALFADGGFVVVWTESGGSKDAVHARLFRPDGTPASGEFRLTAPSTSSSVVTSVVVDVDDSFLVAWNDTLPDHPTRILVQRFNRSGQPMKPAFQVNAPSSRSRYGGKLALCPGGGFALAWSAVEDHITHTDDAGDIYATDVYARVYTAAGAPLGPELRVNENLYDEQIAMDLAVSPNGLLHVLYISWVGENYALLLRNLPIQGRPLGHELRVSSQSPGGVQSRAALSMASDGTFFVAWSDFAIESEVDARRFAANGTPLTADFVVDLEGHRHDGLGGLAALPNGRVVVVWTDFGERDGDGGGVYGRAFGPDGTPLSAHDFQLNRTTAGTQYSPILAGRNGRFVAVWDQGTSYRDPHELRARLLTGN